MSNSRGLHPVPAVAGFLVFIPGYLVRAFSASLRRLAPAWEFRAKSLGDFVCETGGAYRDRTDDLMLAKQPLSQLS